MKRMLSISGELNIELDKYLDGRNFSKFICELVRSELEKDNRKMLKRVETLMYPDPEPNSPQGKELNALVDKIVPRENLLYPSAKKTKTAPKPSLKCFHGRSVGEEYCARCGGVAKA